MSKSSESNKSTRRTRTKLHSMKKFKIHDVKPDGNCLFRAITQSLFNLWYEETLDIETEDYYAKALRLLALNEICKNDGNNKPYKNAPFSYKESIVMELKNEYNYNGKHAFEKYCKCQKQMIHKKNCYPTKVFQWGGINEIHALSKVLKRKIIVCVRNDYQKYNVTINSVKNKGKNPIFILHVNDNHYKALLT